MNPWSFFVMLVGVILLGLGAKEFFYFHKELGRILVCIGGGVFLCGLALLLYTDVMRFMLFIVMLVGVILFALGIKEIFYFNKKVGFILIYAGGAILITGTGWLLQMNIIIFSILIGIYIIWGGDKIVKKFYRYL